MAKTIEQIATALSLSITTIRLVLNGKAEQYRISAATQERIKQYVAQHGYTLNYTARSLKLNKTDTLGLILPRLSNSFFSTLAEKLELRCRSEGYQLIISSSYSDARHENKLVESMLQRNVDGLFIVPSSRAAQKHHQQLTQRPIVVLDRDFGLPACSLVLSDNINGSAELTRAMLAAGLCPIIFLAGDSGQPTIRDRLLGYRQELQRHGMSSESLVITSAHNRRMDGEQLMERWLTEHAQPPQAFIASSLPVLEGALSKLRALRGEIAPEINIGTFDEHPMLSFLPNNIWSVQQNEVAWVDEAFTLMQQSLQSGQQEPARKVVATTLISRLRHER